MLKYDCAHLKRVTDNDIHEGNKGTVRCDVNRAAPDPTTVAGISCTEDCMGYRKVEPQKPGPIEKIKEAFMSLVGK